MINLLNVLKEYQQLESELSKFYLWLSDVFIDNEEIKSFFSKLYREEEQHQAVLLYQMRLIKANPISFRNTEINNLHILKDLRKIIEDFMKSPKNISLEETLKLVYFLEFYTIESYMASTFKNTSKDLDILIRNMFNESNNHLERVKKIMLKRNVEIPYLKELNDENKENLMEILEKSLKNC